MTQSTWSTQNAQPYKKSSTSRLHTWYTRYSPGILMQLFKFCTTHHKHSCKLLTKLVEQSAWNRHGQVLRRIVQQALRCTALTFTRAMMVVAWQPAKTGILSTRFRFTATWQKELAVSKGECRWGTNTAAHSCSLMQVQRLATL